MTIVYNYKEPLREIPKEFGFGYYGCISGTEDMTKIQCHICGFLGKNLIFHIRGKHQMEQADYKEKFGLARKSKLVSPVYSKEKREAYLLKFDEAKRIKIRELATAKALSSDKNSTEIRRSRKQDLRLEVKNKRGSCPDQILSKIFQVEQEIGHVPSLTEFRRYEFGERYWHLIRRTFKTWENALKMAGLEKKVPSNNSSPFVIHKYNSEILLEYLSLRTQETRRIPRYSDLGEGMLPHYTTFARHFGTLENARRLAGVYNLV